MNRQRLIRGRIFVHLLIAVGLLAASLVAATPGTAFACSCNGETSLGRIDADDLIITGRVVAVDGEHPDADRSIDYKIEVLSDPNELLGAERIDVYSNDDAAACGVLWSEGDLIGAILSDDASGYQTSLCASVDPDVVAIYGESVATGDDPTEYCLGLVGPSVVSIREARLIQMACDEAESTGGSLFFVFLDEVYHSQPLDALATIEVVELLPVVSATPYPTVVPTRPARPAPTATPSIMQPASSIVPLTTPLTVTVGLTPSSAPDFGWSSAASAAVPSSAAHAAAVEEVGSAVIRVGFTG